MTKKSARSLRKNVVLNSSWLRKGLRSNRVGKSKLSTSETESKQREISDAPFAYTHIECNEFIHRGHRKLVDDDVPVCSCKVVEDDPESACGDRCLNFITSNECTPGFCPCKELCNNQRFQQKKYIRTKLVKTDERGWGLLADQDVKTGELITEYCGEVISCAEAQLRTQAYEQEGLQDSYIISLSGSEFIDATKKGSLGRFINHSCEPNCETRKWTVLGEVRVGIFAKEFIKAGTELTYDYNFEWYGGTKIRCHCGAPSCVGFLGAKSRGFQEDLYVWDDDDGRYSVENVPLYDSDDDEPLSSFIRRAQVSDKSKKPGTKSVESAPPSPSGVEGSTPFFATEVGKNTEVPAVDIMIKSEVPPLNIKEEEDDSINVTAVHLDTEQKECMNSVKEEPGAIESSDEKLMNNDKMDVHDKETRKKKPAIPSLDARKSLPTEKANLDKTNVSNKRSRTYTNNSGSNEVRSLKAQAIFQYLRSETAREELIAAEKLEETSTLELKRLHEEMRPTFEDTGKDTSESPPIVKAEEWITLTCRQLTATFNFNYMVIKNLSSFAHKE